MRDKGIPSLETAKKQNAALRQVKIVLPHLTFENGELNLRVGKKNLILSQATGHSSDGISVLVEEDRILFAGDAFMPLPYIVDGNLDELVASIKKIGRMGLENIVQGHGDIVLRGEIEAAVKENLAYLSAIRKPVRFPLKRNPPLKYLDGVGIDGGEKSRVSRGGRAKQLHRHNMRGLYKAMLENKDSLEVDE